MPTHLQRKWHDLGQAYSEVRLTSWAQYTEFVQHEMLDYNSYIWRGQRRDDWRLETKLDRLVGSGNLSKEKRYEFVHSHLQQFKLAVRGRRGITPVPLSTDEDWWALGQHHGLATPLLDWSTSPFVAAFFAFIETARQQTRYRAIFALHKPTIVSRSILKARLANLERKEKLRAADAGEIKLGGLGRIAMKGTIPPEVKFIQPLSDENHRLVNQGGLFTSSPSGAHLDQWVQDNYDAEIDKGASLVKVLVPNKEREQALRMLNRMNINHLSLFPDLVGASEFCNLFAQIEKY